MPKITDLDQSLTLAICDVRSHSHKAFKEHGLEGDIQFHEFMARLAAEFAQSSANIAGSIRRDLIERRERRIARRAKTE